jgi:hypothetical protein
MELKVTGSVAGVMGAGAVAVLDLAVLTASMDASVHLRH